MEDTVYIVVLIVLFHLFGPQYYLFDIAPQDSDRADRFGEASHIDFVLEKIHMDVPLETHSPPFRNVTHSYRYFFLRAHIL